MKQYFETLLSKGKLTNCWLIETEDPASTLESLHLFIEANLLANNIAVTNHPDYRLIECDHVKASKCITIEQTRSLQEFFSKTTSLSQYRVAIIYQADLMNLNAANSCLKLLEDTPKNSFIFLITSKPGMIIDTIKSRCAKIRDLIINNLTPADNKCIDYIANYSKPATRIALIEEFGSKDRELWKNFAFTVIGLINKTVKRALNIDAQCNDSEKAILEKLSNYSINNLLQKYSRIKVKINNTIEHDLDLRISALEIMEELYSN